MMRFVDSFDHFNTLAFLAKKWDIVQAGGSGGSPNAITYTATLGRFGTGGLVFAGSSLATSFAVSDQYIQKNHAGNSTVIVGLAVKQTATQIPGNAVENITGGRLLTFLDGASVQVAIRILPSGQLQAFRNVTAGDGPFPNIIPTLKFTTLGTSTAAISSSAYDFLEVKVVHHPTTGSVTVRQNGVTIWTLSNVNTAISGSNNSSSVIAGGACWDSGGTRYNDGVQIIIDDFHLLDITVNGGDANDPIDFIGDRRWEVGFPTADGNYEEWTRSAGADSWDLVNDNPPDDDTTYVSSATVNQRDTFVVQDSAGIVGAGAIICLTMYCKKLAGGSNEVKGLARLAGTDRLGGAFQTPADYAFRQSFSCTDPAGNPWTVGNYNSSEQGFQKTA